MKLPPEVLEAVGTETKISSLLTLLLTLAEEEDIHKEIQKIRYGITHKFHYNMYEMGKYYDKPKSGYIAWSTGGSISYNELWDELDDRRALIKRLIFEYAEDDDILEER